MAEFAQSAGVEFDREDSGILHIYKKEADFAHAHRVTDMLAKAGLQRRKLTPAEVYDIEPALRAEVLGGYYTDSDFTGDIHKFTNGLAEAARQAGVNFAMNTQITDIQHEGDTPHLFWEDLDGASSEQRFDGVVITAGVMSRKLAAALGDSVNVYPVRAILLP